jgi:hypothetical protein
MNVEMPLRPSDTKREPVTLLDMFANSAMQAVLGGVLSADLNALAGAAPTHVAHIASTMANAMLKERAKCR